MTRILLSLLLFALVAQVLAGCRGVHRDPNDSLPEDWPINQLSLPKDAELAQEPLALHSEDPAMTTREWIVVFNNDRDWPGLVQHIEACLKPIGYFRQKVARGPAGGVAVEVHTYYSPDFLTEVVLSNGARLPGSFEAGSVEFALWVIERSEPNEVISQVLDIKQARPEMGETLLDGIVERIH